MPSVNEATNRYTHGHHESVLRSHRWRTAQNSAAYLLPSLRAGLDLLDVGCGPGALTAVLGLLFIRGGFVPGLSALDSSAQISAHAAIGSRACFMSRSMATLTGGESMPLCSSCLYIPTSRCA